LLDVNACRQRFRAFGGNYSVAQFNEKNTLVCAHHHASLFSCCACFAFFCFLPLPLACCRTLPSILFAAFASAGFGRGQLFRAMLSWPSEEADLAGAVELRTGPTAAQGCVTAKCTLTLGTKSQWRASQILRCGRPFSTFARKQAAGRPVQ